MKSPLLIDWDAREFSEVRPDIHGCTIVSADLTISMYRYAAGSQWEEHRHPEDQLTIVMSGEIRFRSGGDELQPACRPAGPDPRRGAALGHGRGRRGGHAERVATA